MSAAREEAHGQTMSADSQTSNSTDHRALHCHECWRYTDDKNERANTVDAAVRVLCNAADAAVRDSYAFKAADELLAATFKRDAKGAPLPDAFRL
jgi:hypothetical protein